MVAIALLFFLHGGRLSRQAVMARILHWRLHLTVIAFIIFPLLGMLSTQLPEAVLPVGSCARA